MNSITSCKHATELMSQALDTDLGFGNRSWLVTHLMMCHKCRECQHQLQLLKEATAMRRKLMEDLNPKD